MFRRIWIILLSLSIGGYSACTLAPQTNPNNQTEEVATAQTTVINTPLPLATPDNTFPALISDTTRTLRIWIPPELLLTDEAGVAVLEEQIREFERAQIDLEIILESKFVSGQGGILSYLRTGRNIAPEILPDLVVLPAEQLPAVLADELITPLDNLFDISLIDELYPAAQAFAQTDEVMAGFPFALTHLSHFAYNSETITQTLRPGWDQLILDENNSLAAPIGGRDGGVLVLQFYVEAGGSLVNEADQISLQADILTLALDKLQASIDQDLLDVTVSQGSSAEEMWEAFVLDRTAIIITTSEAYLNQEDVGFTAVAPISGIGTPLTPYVYGWAWAIATPNSTQQALAADLLTYLTQVEVMGHWSASSRLLPAHPDAFAQWENVDQAYLSFVQEQLLIAQAIPPNATLALLTLLQEAAQQVVSGEANPQTAAETAVSQLQE